MKRYERGERLRHEDVNQYAEAAEIVFAGYPTRNPNRSIKAKVHQAFPAFSVMGFGFTNSIPYDEPPIIPVKDPTSESVSPYYTNDTFDVDENDTEIHLYPIGPRPVKIRVSGTIAPGDRASPNDAGEAVKGAGGLLCVSDQDGTFAQFVAIPTLQTVDIKLPDTGIPARAGDQYGSADCEVVSLDADGKGSVVGTIKVWNWESEVISVNGTGLGQATFQSDGKWHITSQGCSTSGSRTDIV